MIACSRLSNSRWQTEKRAGKRMGRGGLGPLLSFPFCFARSQSLALDQKRAWNRLEKLSRNTHYSNIPETGRFVNELF